MSRVTKGRYRRGPYSQLQLDGKVCWFALPPTIGGDPRMFRASLLAFGDLFAPRVAALLVATMVLSLVTFCLIWWGIDWSLGFWLPEPGAWPAWLSWLESLLTFAGPWLGAVLTFAMAWFLFPLVASAFLALFLEPIAAAIEARHYPALGRAPGLPLVTTMLATLRLLALVVLCNVGLLAVLVAFPVAYPAAWLLANGWLLGREYFELVGLRRLSPVAARQLRARHGTEVFAAGIGVVLLSMLPIVNLVVPVFATALMVHQHAAWRASSHSIGG